MGVSQELVPETVCRALATLPRVQAGRSEVAETEPEEASFGRAYPRSQAIRQPPDLGIDPAGSAEALDDAIHHPRHARLHPIRQRQ